MPRTYQQLAGYEEDATLAYVYHEMSAIEKSHAQVFAKKQNLPLAAVLNPSWRAKTLNRIGKIFGYDYVPGSLMDTEKSLSKATIYTKEKISQYLHYSFMRTRYNWLHQSVMGNKNGSIGLVDNSL
jgi:vacuolar iron transporter family protein